MSTTPESPGTNVPGFFFDYALPESLIAQHPADRRDAARLLVLNRAAGTISHRHFRDLPDYLRPGDLLVLNDTKVIPARLVGRRERTGGKWEALYLRTVGDDWELLATTRGRPDTGTSFVTDSGLRLILTGRTADRHWLMRPDPSGDAATLLATHGQIPLPPYIRDGRADASDTDRYQTVYAAHPGSVAAPTAGLHFTPELLATLETNGIRAARVTLHVGLGTFAPVKVDDPTQHQIHAEWCEVSAETCDAIRTTKVHGGRVIAVGTTTTRTLETSGGEPFRGESSLFIHPPYRFRVVDALVTNFHLPRTTLLLLVQALSGSELLRRAYAEAVSREYRFFSYGDAMLVV